MYLPGVENVFKSLLARRCIVCGEVNPLEKLDLGCCPDCKQGLHPVKNGFCPGCGFVYFSEDVYLCLDCREKNRPWSKLGFFNQYTGMLRNLIIDFKFNKHLETSKLLQKLLHWAYSIHYKHSTPDMLIPVPLHSKRLCQRGFNQSKEMAREISLQENIPIYSRILKRVKNTRSQLGLSREQRAENLTRAIGVENIALNSEHVLLVDDIYTTGSTMKACADALNSAGAKRVDVLVLARVMDKI